MGKVVVLFKKEGDRSQPPSLENPFVGYFDKIYQSGWFKSQPPSLENPFVGINLRMIKWKVPLVSTSKPGESLCGKGIEAKSVATTYGVSTSKPGESLCGISTARGRVVSCLVSTSKPGESLCGATR